MIHLILHLCPTQDPNPLQDISAEFLFKPNKKFLVKADYHIFNLASDADSIYNAGGGILRPQCWVPLMTSAKLTSP